MSSIRQKYEVTQSPWPGLSQAFYKLEDASEYLLIDLAVLKQNSQEKFLEPKIHGKAVLYFDKSGAAEIPKPDQDKFANKLQGRLNRLKARFEMFNIFVQKEINRGNYLEAIDLYFNLTLASLVEAIRMKHNPVHFDFKMRYIYREIPPGINERLEQLYSVDNREDLQTKYEQATKWFKRVISKMG